MEPENPNPVFGYRAGFRRSAKRAQSWLLMLGLLLLLASVPVLIVAQSIPALALAGCGSLFLLVGILWGYSWRGTVRDEFQKKFGPQA